MEALRRNLTGEGNGTGNLAESERLNESLHYKSQIAIYFEISLTQFQGEKKLRKGGGKNDR